MTVKLADLVKQDAKNEKWFKWTPEDAESPILWLLLRVVLPREFVRIRARHTKRVFSRKARGFQEKTDDESAADELLRLAVRDWKGVTVGAVKELTITNKIESPDDAVIQCTPENVKELTEAVPELGAWVIETSSDARLFNQPTEEETTENLS